jgi:hypothetical protein
LGQQFIGGELLFRASDRWWHSSAARLAKPLLFFRRKSFKINAVCMVWAVASIADEHDFFMIEILTDGAGKFEEGRFRDGGLFSTTAVVSRAVAFDFSTTAVVTSQHSCSLLFYSLLLLFPRPFRASHRVRYRNFRHLDIRKFCLEMLDDALL